MQQVVIPRRSRNRLPRYNERRKLTRGEKEEEEKKGEKEDQQNLTELFTFVRVQGVCVGTVTLVNLFVLSKPGTLTQFTVGTCAT